MTHRLESKRFALAVIALTGLAAGAAFAAEPLAAPVAGPILVAQSGTMPALTAGVVADAAFPAHQAGVRAAAAKGPEALRRYIQRTRGIYDFYYWDFAPQRR